MRMQSMMIIGLGFLGALLLKAATPSGNITLVWDYNTNDLDTNMTFVVYHSTNVTVPLTNWAVLTNVVGTNLSVNLKVVPGPNFFALKATNFWGTSDFSEVASTPALPRSDAKLKVVRVVE